MRTKSPISIDRLQCQPYFCPLTDEDIEEGITYIHHFELVDYDDRHDFDVDKSLEGLAVKIDFYNEILVKGSRRSVEVSIVDMTSRCEVSSQTLKVNIPRERLVRPYYLQFPTETTALVGNHTYRLTVTDIKTSESLADTVIHLFDTDVLGEPDKWYEIIDGGIKPSWESTTYKVLNTVDAHEYYVRFNLTPKLNPMYPKILPELELRLHYPEGKVVKSYFNEPKYFGLENYKDGILTVEFPFETCDEYNGVFYAELLCMEYPVAGFVFDTTREKVSGTWFDRDIEPLEEYSPEAAVDRLDSLMPRPQPSGWNDDVFDNMLDEFVSSQLKEAEAQAEADSSSECETGSSDVEKEVTETNSEAEVAEVDTPVSTLSCLDHLTGLNAVKKKLITYEKVVSFNKRRAEIGLPTSDSPLHAMFLGSPGTGKTTVAHLMGAMLHLAGVLSKGHVVVRERATLLGQFYSSEGEKTLEAIEEAQGGILFIDEAYQLFQPHDPRDPGKFVIETLLTSLADESKRDWMLILAGYPDEMKKMFDMNPGFKSRIPDSNIYTFDDFTESELMEIAERYLESKRYTLTSEAHEALSKRLNVDYNHRGKNFGNARHVLNLIQTEILPSMAVRVINEGLSDDRALTEIQLTDIPPIVKKPSTSRRRVGYAV